MKKIGFSPLLFAMLMAWVSPTDVMAQQFKMATVDMQRALNLCEAGKEAKGQITQEVEKIQKTFVNKQKELEKLKEDLEKRGAVMSEAVRKEKEGSYQAKLRDLQRLQRDYEEDLRGKEREYTQRILKILEVIVKKLGEERQYTLIMERTQSGIIFVPNTLDLTDEVIQLVNQQKSK